MSKELIVGIDPGTTAGVALINLNGKLVDVKSGKNFGREKIISYIISNGSPALIATDKKKAPSNVEKISRSFDAKLFVPDKDLAQEEKDELVEDIELEDSHQLDALASALHAYKINSDKLERIEETLQQLNLLDHVEKVKSKVLKEDSENITAAIEDVLEGEEEEESEEEKKTKEETWEEKPTEKEGKIGDLRDELSQTKDAVKTLKDYSEKLKDQKKDLEERLEERKKEVKRIKEGRKDEVMKMDEVKKLGETVQSLRRGLKKEEEENEKMESKLELFRKLEKKRREGLVPAYVVDNFNKKGLENIRKKYGLENSVLFFENVESPNLSIIEILKENKVKAVIGVFEGKLREELIENDIPLIPADEIEEESEIEEEIKFIEPEEFESGKKVDREGFISWLKNYKRR